MAWLGQLTWHALHKMQFSSFETSGFADFLLRKTETGHNSKQSLSVPAHLA
jgi:hypothetical protein